MPELGKIVTKYAGVKICDLDADELREFLGAIAQLGASNALEKVGLGDETAGNDVKDLRDLLSGYRVARAAAWQQIGRLVITIFTLFLITQFVDIGHVQALKWLKISNGP